MVVALASRSARARSDDTRAIVAERQHQAVLRAHAPRLARRLQRTFEKLRDSFIHSGAKAAGDDLALTYSTPDYDSFRRELNQVLQTEYINIGTIAVDAVEAQLGVTLAFDLNERIIRAADIGNRVKGITDDTRDALRNTIQRGIDDGSHPSTIAKTLRDQLNGWAGLEDLTRSRAYTIARTETANAYNVGAILGYRESGIIGQLRVLDGATCGWLTHNDPDRANGKIVTLDEAQANPISHPNCVRAFAPVAAGLEKPSATTVDDALARWITPGEDFPIRQAAAYLAAGRPVTGQAGEDARVLMNAIASAPRVQTPLWRGEQLTQLPTVGSKLDRPLSAWTETPGNAFGYAQSPAGAAVFGQGQSGREVVFRVVGAKAIRAPEFEEWVGSGRYVVRRVDARGATAVIELEFERAFRPRS